MATHRPMVAVQRVLRPQAPQLGLARGSQLLRKVLQRTLLAHPTDIG